MIDFKINIAGIIIAFESESPDIQYEASRDELFKGFICSKTKKPDVRFRLKYGQVPEFEKKRRLFKSGRILGIYTLKDKFLYEYRGTSMDRIDRSALVNKEFTEVIIYNNRERTVREITPQERGRKILTDIWGGFLLAFMIDYLAKYENGILAHAVSLKDNSRTYLFMGKGGSGKSTLAKIWGKEDGVRVFNDDQAILKFEDGRTFFYNFPRRGSDSPCIHPRAKDRERMDRIFFIFQGKGNSLRPVNGPGAPSRIFQNIFPPFWNKKGLAETLGICASIARDVPCFDLDFVKDESIVEFVRNSV